MIECNIVNNIAVANENGEHVVTQVITATLNIKTTIWHCWDNGKAFFQKCCQLTAMTVLGTESSYFSKYLGSATELFI